MKILAFAASNHSQSINRDLVGYAVQRLHADMPDLESEILDLNDYEMPIYSIDREKDTGIPEQARSFFDKIGAADAVIVSFAEYNGQVTSAWKNIFDWMSRIDMKVWQDKPAVLFAASPGGRAGASVLEAQKALAPFFGMDLKGSYGVGSWGEAWDGAALTKAADIEAVDQALAGLKG